MKSETHYENERLMSVNPADGSVVWEGRVTDVRAIDDVIARAAIAFTAWSRTALDQRIGYLNTFKAVLGQQRDEFAQLISEETGKPLWEAKTEVGAMLGKVAVSIQAYCERCGERRADMPGGISVTRFKPHGVVGVLGPFNLPGHLPNGHIVPALLAGNTVVFKPSDYTPAVGERLLQCWDAAGLPAGVLQCVQGGRAVGSALASHPALKGLYFTGSFATGQALHRQFAGHPEKILALEMGGNNPLLVHRVGDLSAAAYNTIQSAYITSGQRCVCARRLIVPHGRAGDAFIATLLEMLRGITVGAWNGEREPFMGPVIAAAAGNRMMDVQAILLNRGAVALLPMQQDQAVPALLTPGLIDVTHVQGRDDSEYFGPLLQLIRVNDFPAAIDEANRTEYGLSAGLLSDDAALYEVLLSRSQAGIVNWNRQMTGASSAAPFGGIGKSGNHRPSAYFAADYCAYPVASIESRALVMPKTLTPGINL